VLWERAGVLLPLRAVFLGDTFAVLLNRNGDFETVCLAVEMAKWGEGGCWGEEPRLLCPLLGSKEVSFRGSGS
jgi:hypothetical protein